MLTFSLTVVWQHHHRGSNLIHPESPFAILVQIVSMVRVLSITRGSPYTYSDDGISYKSMTSLKCIWAVSPVIHGSIHANHNRVLLVRSGLLQVPKWFVSSYFEVSAGKMPNSCVPCYVFSGDASLTWLYVEVASWSKLTVYVRVYTLRCACVCS